MHLIYEDFTSMIALQGFKWPLLKPVGALGSSRDMDSNFIESSPYPPERMLLHCFAAKLHKCSVYHEISPRFPSPRGVSGWWLNFRFQVNWCFKNKSSDVDKNMCFKGQWRSSWAPPECVTQSRMLACCHMPSAQAHHSEKEKRHTCSPVLSLCHKNQNHNIFISANIP